MHAEHPEIGGAVVPFGFDNGPANEGEAEEAARRASQRTAMQGAHERSIAADEARADLFAKADAARELARLERQTTPTRF